MPSAIVRITNTLKWLIWQCSRQCPDTLAALRTVRNVHQYIPKHLSKLINENLIFYNRNHRLVESYWDSFKISDNIKEIADGSYCGFGC